MYLIKFLVISTKSFFRHIWLVRKNSDVTIALTEEKIRLDRMRNIIYHHFLLVRRRGLVQVFHNLRIVRTEGGLYAILSHLGFEQDVVYLMLCDESCTHVRYILQPNSDVLGKNRKFVTTWRSLLKSWKEKVTSVVNRGPLQGRVDQKFTTWHVYHIG